MFDDRRWWICGGELLKVAKAFHILSVHQEMLEDFCLPVMPGVFHGRRICSETND